MKLKIIIRRSLTATMLILLTACGAEDAPESSTADDGVLAKPKIALVMKSLANEFFVNMARGAEEHRAGYCQVNCPELRMSTRGKV